MMSLQNHVDSSSHAACWCKGYQHLDCSMKKPKLVMILHNLNTLQRGARPHLDGLRLFIFLLAIYLTFRIVGSKLHGIRGEATEKMNILRFETHG